MNDYEKLLELIKEGKIYSPYKSGADIVKYLIENGVTVRRSDIWTDEFYDYCERYIYETGNY